MSRKKHPKKDIESAIRYAESKGWLYVKAGASAHIWGSLRCPTNSKDCRCGEHCSFGVFSTPKNTSTHAKQIRRKVDGCIFQDQESES